MTFLKKLSILVFFMVGFFGQGFADYTVIDVLDEKGHSFLKEEKKPLSEILPGAPKEFSYVKQRDDRFQIVEMACAEGKEFKNYAPDRDPTLTPDILLATATTNGSFLDMWTSSGIAASCFLMNGGDYDGSVIKYVSNQYKPQMAAHFNNYIKNSVVVINSEEATAEKPIKLSENAKNVLKELAGSDGGFYGNIYQARGSFFNDRGEIVQGSSFSSGNVDLSFLSDSGLKPIQNNPEWMKLVTKNR